MDGEKFTMSDMSFDPLEASLAKPSAEPREEVIEKKKAVTDYPSLYQVLLLNDDFTPMDFVITILQKIFHKNREEAESITLQTHTQGQGKCGSFTREVAETKMMQVIHTAREYGHPLKCIINKE